MRWCASRRSLVVGQPFRTHGSNQHYFSGGCSPAAWLAPPSATTFNVLLRFTSQLPFRPGLPVLSTPPESLTARALVRIRDRPTPSQTRERSGRGRRRRCRPATALTHVSAHRSVGPASECQKRPRGPRYWRASLMSSPNSAWPLVPAGAGSATPPSRFATCVVISVSSRRSSSPRSRNTPPHSVQCSIVTPLRSRLRMATWHLGQSNSVIGEPIIVVGPHGGTDGAHVVVGPLG